VIRPADIYPRATLAVVTRLRKAILWLGIVNASLYSALLPLWEGFDEPAHYGYVESLWQTHRLPVLGRTTFPADVLASFRYAPGSYLMRRWRPETVTYEDWYRLTGAQRGDLRARLEALRAGGPPGAETNYQAHHPPLAYIPLAAIDHVLFGWPITTRVLILRLTCAVCSVVLVFFGALALCRELRLPPRCTDALLFTLFCAQMFYGATAHVANDWLAVALAAWCFAAVAAYVNGPGGRRPFAAAAWLALGLLTKAYFLAIGIWYAAVAAMMTWRGYGRAKPVLLGAALVAAAAGPWYVRNLAVYGNLSGTYEAFTGVGVRQALAAAPQIDWPAAAGTLARGSLWMGNNSGTSFSRATLDLTLVLLALAVAAWAARAKSIGPAEKAVFAGIAVYVLAMAYAVCSAFACEACSFRQASPWYAQVLLVPVLALAWLGMARWGRIGAGLAMGTVALWTWILVATWVVKLFPMYSGAGPAPMHAGDLWNWYAHRAAANATAFSQTVLVPAPVLYIGLLLSLGLTVTLSIAVARGLGGPEERKLIP
jgi:hypothetical protein